MKFTVSSSVLFNHLQSVGKVIASKSALPILDNFLFELVGNQLAITASDQETTLTTSIAVENAEGNGKIAMASKTLLESLKEFSDQPITFEVNDSNLSVSMISLGGKFDFIGQNGAEFPLPNEIEAGATSITISANDLLDGISYTLFATSDDELRPVMTGIYFDIEQEQLTFVATDSHKLVRFTNGNIKSSQKASFILPKKPANMLRTVLAKEDGNSTIEFDGKNACFQLSNYKMYCRLIESKFPEYNRVIPETNPYRIVIDRANLVSAVRRVSAFSDQTTKLTKMEFNNNELKISAQDIEFSCSAIEKVACQYEGDPCQIGFKSSLLIEILQNINCKDVVLIIGESSRPGLFCPLKQEEEDNKDLLMLLMPMLLN